MGRLVTFSSVCEVVQYKNAAETTPADEGEESSRLILVRNWFTELEEGVGSER